MYLEVINFTTPPGRSNPELKLISRVGVSLGLVTV
jgi:hypothetical protein